MHLRFTTQKLFDCIIIASMLSFCIGIVLVNFGEYPLIDKVSGGNLAATSVYIVFWAFFIYIVSVFKRKTLMLFSRIFTTVCLLFQVWFTLATASSTIFIPNPAARPFSLLTVFLNNPFIGLYFFIPSTDGYTYALVSSLIVFALCAFSWITWLSYNGYFDALRSKISSRPRRKTRNEALKEEILELRRQKKEKRGDDK